MGLGLHLNLSALSSLTQQYLKGLKVNQNLAMETQDR